MKRATRGLTATEDAYGQILLAAYEGRGGQEITERDDGLVSCRDPGDCVWPFRRRPAVERLLDGAGWRVARLVDDGSPRYGAVLEKERAAR